MTDQEQYDDAMFAFSTGDFASAIEKLKGILAANPEHFEAQLALGMAHCRVGDYPAAIAEGHRAETLRPKEQLVHTNLSLFYMKAGDKTRAEHHGVRARVAGWQSDKTPPGSATVEDPELKIARPAPPPMKLPDQMPDMPWKKKPPAGH